MIVVVDPDLASLTRNRQDTREKMPILETLRFVCVGVCGVCVCVFERTKHQPRGNLHSYVVLQRPCNEAALSPRIDAFWY